MSERIEIVERALEHMFHRVLRESAGDPPQLRDVSLQWDHYADSLLVRARFHVEGQEQDRFFEDRISRWDAARWGTDGLSVVDRAQRGHWVYSADALWSRMYEDHYVNRAMRAAEIQVLENASDPGLAHARMEQLRHLREHMAQWHRSGPELVDITTRNLEGFSRGIEPTTAVEVRSCMAEAQSRMAREMEHRMLRALGMADAATSNVAAEEGGTLTLDAIREAAQALSRNPYHDDWRRAFEEPAGPEDYGWARATAYYGHRLLRQEPIIGIDWGLGEYDVGTKEAQERGLALLKDNLTPAQRRQYDKHKFFDVKGGDSGTWYRIHHGRQMNIKELNWRGQPKCGWCFLPQGGLVAGDVMLAQKTALELFEYEALKIANQFAV